jgi:hypothetical protein
MGIACPAGLNTAVLRSEISAIYGRVASEPNTTVAVLLEVSAGTNVKVPVAKLLFRIGE